MIPDLYYLIPIGVLAGTSAAASAMYWLTDRRERALYGECKRLARRVAWLEGELVAEQEISVFWRERADSYADRLVTAETDLYAIKAKRSANVAKGNHTRALKANALRDATTAQLAGEVQAKVRKPRLAA